MHRYVAVGRSFFSPLIAPGPKNLGLGVEGWKGFYQSIRPTQKGLSVIVGMISLVHLNSYDLSKFSVIS
jgi:eukaryotic translation initiation factor 2C